MRTGRTTFTDHPFKRRQGGSHEFPPRCPMRVARCPMRVAHNLLNLLGVSHWSHMSHGFLEIPLKILDIPYLGEQVQYF
jgi:hypothetical protein